MTIYTDVNTTQPLQRTAEEKVAAGLALASQIEAEAMRSYRKPPDRLDPIITVRRIRIALGLEGPT